MRRLYDLDPNEVSLVPRGANKKKFLIFKSRRGDKMAASQEIRNLINSVDEKTMSNISRIVKSMRVKKAHGEEKEDTDSAHLEKDHDGAPLTDRAQAALKAVARIIAPFKDEISDDHLDAVQRKVGIGGESEEAEKSKDGEKVEMSMAIPEGIEEEHHSSALDFAKKAYMGHLEKMGYQKYPEQQPKVGSRDGSKMDEDEEDDEEEDSVSKVSKSAAVDLSAFPQGQRAQLESIFKAHSALVDENKELVKKTADLEKELKVERDERLTKEFQERAKSFRHLGANTEELATILKSLSSSNPSEFARVEAVLKSADEAIRVANVNGGLFTEIGSRQGRSNGTGAEERLNALVASVVQKSDGAKSEAQIYDEVIRTKEGGRLYAEYKASRAGGI